MVFGYCRVSTKGQLDGNSIEEQTQTIKCRYTDVEIIIESYSGAKDRPTKARGFIREAKHEDILQEYKDLCEI